MNHMINKITTLFFIIIPSYGVGRLSHYLVMPNGSVDITTLFIMMALSCSVGINSWNFINKRF